MKLLNRKCQSSESIMLQEGKKYSSFFKFVTDGSGSPYYFDTFARKKIKEDPDSENNIIRHFLNNQKCNVYRCHKNKLIIEKIERKDDSEQIRSWLNDFILTDEYQDLCWVTIQIKPGALYGMKDPCKEIQLLGVQIYGECIQFITNPDKDVQLAAVKQDDRAIKFIEKPCSEAIEYVIF